MQTKWKVLITTAIITVPAFMFGAGSPQGAAFWEGLWPYGPEERAEPDAGLVPMFMVLGVLEGVMLGLAVSLLVWGRSAFIELTGGDALRGNLLAVAAAWLVGNWWIHNSLHMVNELDFMGLLIIDYAFHVTLMAAGVYLVYHVVTRMRGPSPTPSTTPTAANA